MLSGGSPWHCVPKCSSCQCALKVLLAAWSFVLWHSVLRRLLVVDHLLVVGSLCHLVSRFSRLSLLSVTGYCLFDCCWHMLYVSLCIVSGGAFRALCVGDFRLLLAFLLEWLQLGHCCWLLSPASRGHAPPRFGALQWSLRELPRWLGCLRRTPSHSSLCEMRSARRGVADETLPTARATQCWCLLLDNQTERPGTPCLVKEEASQTSRHSCAPPHLVRISWYTSAILRVLSCHAWHAALASVLLGRDTVLCGKPMQSLGCWTGKDASLSKLTVFCPGECDNRLSQIRVLSGFVSLALVVSSAAA